MDSLESSEQPSPPSNTSRYYTIPTVYNIRDHLSKQKAIKDEYCNNGIDYEFGYAGCEDITRMENEKLYYASAIKGENYFKKNRYTDVLALEETRIKLNNLQNDYINANRVPGRHFNFDHGMNWIVTQGPTNETCSDFWYMIYQESVELIVMLCKLQEKGRCKCAEYWPAPGETKTFNTHTNDGSYTMTVTSKGPFVEEETDILKRQFVLQYQGSERTITQYQYVGWPDHGVPSDCGTFRKLMEIVRPYCADEKGPVIHCSAGIGRSSTFVASMIIKEKLHYYMNHPEEYEGQHFDFEVFETVRQLRNFRSGSVQNQCQYEFIYTVMQEEAEALGYECPSNERN